MKSLEKSHNLLIVSDMHLAEGRLVEAGENSYGHEAFLYDGSFVRFLRYHEQLRRDAIQRLVDLDDENEQSVQDDDHAQERDKALIRPWRLVLAGDIFDFWDIVRVPDDLEDLKREILRLKEEIDHKDVRSWLQAQLHRLDEVEKSGKPPYERSYDEVRGELDRFGMLPGPQRRAVENLAWWIEVLIQKPWLKLSKTEHRHGLGTSWQEVVWKLTHVYRGHREFFAGLAWFIACGNDVILLKGNHDLELHWPQVHNGHFPHTLADAYQDLLDGSPIGPSFDNFPTELLSNLPDVDEFRALLPAYVLGQPHTSEGKRFTFQDWFYCEEDLIYVEHGNQYEPLDSSVKFLAPKLPSDPKRIELPWGAFMTRYVYNKIVAVHPFAVNLKPEERIIHWMVNNDLFRILGILTAEFPSVIRALGRAFKQGLRGEWIWGDRSIFGLIPRLIYDFIQLVTPGQWEEDERIKVEHEQRVSEIVNAYAPGGGRPPEDQTQSAQAIEIEAELARESNRRRLYARFLRHLGSLGLILSMVVGVWLWLTQSEQPDWMVPVLGVFGALTLVGVVLGVSDEKTRPRQSLGELLLQLGGIGFVTGLIADLFLAKVLGWGLGVQLLVPGIPFVLGILGVVMIRTASETGETWERTFLPKMMSGAWPAIVLHSSASVFSELSLFSFITAVFFFLSPLERMEVMPWVLASVSLLVASFFVSRLYTLYVERWSLERVILRWLEAVNSWVRMLATVVVGLLIIALLIGFLAPVVVSSLESVPQAKDIKNFAQRVDDFATGSSGIADLPLLIVLFAALGGVILLETWIRGWFRGRIRSRERTTIESLNTPEPGAKRIGRGIYGWDAKDVLEDQLQAIEDLANREQRRFAKDIFKVFSFFVPILSVIILVVGVLGLGAAVGSMSELIENVNPVGGLSISAIMAFVYWLLRQFSASVQRQDPASGFGDLFYRMASNIATILSYEAGEDVLGLGRPSYFVFGHDHWADTKLIQEHSRDSGEVSSEIKKRWYVNSGTWLRGYVEEQRRQEVSENHSTFVQIIPDLDVEEAPRVLRWNDNANQPEHIVRREEPRSAGKLLWDRWGQQKFRLFAWVVVLLISSLMVVQSNPGLLSGLRPYGWAFGSWLLVSTFEPLSKWLRRRR
jgi:hypothetical protein